MWARAFAGLGVREGRGPLRRDYTTEIRDPLASITLHTSSACAALAVLKSFNLPNLWGLDRLGAPLLRGKGPLVEPSWKCTYCYVLYVPHCSIHIWSYPRSTLEDPLSLGKDWGQGGRGTLSTTARSLLTC